MRVREIPKRGSRHLARRSVADQAADELRQMILTGDFEPDETVTQDELAELLGVSTMPVREAILRLSHEGLMTVHPGKSIQVTAPTREDITDVYWMHSVLAGELAARAARRGGETLAGELRDLIKQDEAATEFSDHVALNWDFHRLINQAAGSRKLLLSYRNTLRFIPERYFENLVDWPELSADEHRAITDRIAQRDGEGARYLAQKHAWESGRVLVANLETLGILHDGHIAPEAESPKVPFPVAT